MGGGEARLSARTTGSGGMSSRSSNSINSNSNRFSFLSGGGGSVCRRSLWGTCLFVVLTHLCCLYSDSAVFAVQLFSSSPSSFLFGEQSAESVAVPLKPSYALAANVVVTNSTFDSVANARFPNGSRGYIADPSLVQRQRKEEAFSFFHALREENDNVTSNTSMDSICGTPGGQGLEDTGGWQLLTQKVQNIKVFAVHKSSAAFDDFNSSSYPKRPRLFCAIYTHSNQRHLARMVALSYGVECDGFLAFSNETIPHWGAVDLVHVGPESYHNMWHKVQAIWSYIGQHYLDDYDYFHLGGDDMYVLVDNLKYFLSRIQQQPGKEPEPIFAGQWVRQKTYPYVAGGPGYTLNREAVRRLAPIIHTCFPDSQVSYEDRLVSLCLRTRLNVHPHDSRDPDTAEQLYHDVPPHQVFTGRPASGRRASFHARGMAYWETLPHPSVLTSSASSSSLLLLLDDKKENASNAHVNATREAKELASLQKIRQAGVVGPKYGLEAAGRYSVSFHRLHTPMFMSRIHAIVHRLCPINTSLGQSLVAALATAAVVGD